MLSSINQKLKQLGNVATLLKLIDLGKYISYTIRAKTPKYSIEYKSVVHLSPTLV